jgi:hypothetical protein
MSAEAFAATVLITQAPTANRSPQVFLLYRRQNYDPDPAMLGVWRAARYFAAEVNGIDEAGATSAVLHELTSTASQYWVAQKVRKTDLARQSCNSVTD